MKKRISKIWLALVVSWLLVGSAQATLMLDQEQSIYDFENYRPSSGYKEGQSFTTGLTGTLKQIDMGFLKNIDGDGTVEIFSGSGNQGALLQTVAVQIYSEDNGQINYNSFIVDVPVESGLQYTFYFEPNALTMLGPFYFGTSQTNPYVGGEWHEVSYGDPSSYSIGDIVFRTWVETVPEPGTAYYVDALNGDDDNDGLSPETAFATIQSAIDSANDADTVIVAPGTYTGDGNRDIDFLGKAITVQSIDPNDPCVVAAAIIDCNGSYAEPHRGFYFHTAEDANSVVSGFTIRGGCVEYKGGGIYCEDSSPRIENCYITDNIAFGVNEDILWPPPYGGGIFCLRSSVIITNCTISGNSSDEDGGGIYCEGSSPTISNCIISGNRAQEFGGGIVCSGGTPIITSCTIEGNSAHTASGISCLYNTPTITDCIITGNSADSYGGGIFCYRSNLSITNCTITRNTAQRYGGGICCRYSNAAITDCLIIGNSGGGGVYCDQSSPKIRNCHISDNSGSGVHLLDSNPTITNCNITGNSAGSGGGIHCYRSSSPKITNCTISRNSANHYGGGICCLENNNPTITNCILWDNTALRGDEIALLTTGRYSSTASVSYSDIQGGEMGVYVLPPSTLNWGTGNIRLYPYFISLDDYHLRLDSPCINAGDPVGDYSRQTDIDGEPRIIEGRVDMGADEFIYEEPPMLVGLQITGPEEVVENFSAQYIAVASYNDGSTRNMTTTVIWTLEPQTYASIDENGLLHTGDIDKPEDITIYAQYTDGGVTLDAEMTVRIYLSNIWYVPVDYQTIQAAINAAEDSDTVIVADGIYTGEGNRDIDFLGKAITVRSQNGPDNCIINCQALGRGFYFHSGERKNSVLDGFTITNGRTGEFRYGGGISCKNSGPTVRNCIITGNDAADSGGGICGGYGTFSNCIISGNSALFSGGGIWGSHAKFINCSIIRNTAKRGGGICGWQNSNTEIINCLISNNTADSHGGGIRCMLGSLTIINCTITENSGLGLHIKHSSVAITNSIIWDNIFKSYSFATITYSDLQSSYGGEGNIDADPCFIDPCNGDYHLLAGSPCIDAGDNTAVPLDTTDLDGDGNTAEPIPFDLDGNPRIVDGNDDGNSVVDMGAFEAMVSCFGVNHLKVGTKADKKGNEVELKGTFSPALPIDLVRDDVAYIIDDGQGNALVFLIPAGSFKVDGKPGKQKFKFHSAKGSQPDIKAKFDFDKCKFELKAKRVQGTDEITSTTLTIELWAGANVVEEVVEVEVKPKHTEYKRKPKLNCCPKCKGIALLEVTSTGPFTGDEYVLLFEPDPGKEKLKRKTVVDDGVNGRVKIDTSCSKPLDVGDVFGPYTVTDLIKIFDD